MARRTDYTLPGKGAMVLRGLGYNRRAQGGRNLQAVVEGIDAGQRDGRQATLWNEPIRAAIRGRLRRGEPTILRSFLVRNDAHLVLKGVGQWVTPHGKGFTSTNWGRLLEWTDQHLLA
jgi:hypothetical protein